MRKARKHYTAEEKVAILRRHLVDRELVSKLCDELALQPTVFYRWQKEFFENGAAACPRSLFTSGGCSRQEWGRPVPASISRSCGSSKTFVWKKSVPPSGMR